MGQFPHLVSCSVAVTVTVDINFEMEEVYELSKNMWKDINIWWY